MRLHPQIIQHNGIVSVSMVASFVGDLTDTTDQTRIQAYGDPSVNLVGLMSDPADPTFQFTFGTTELFVGITTQMQNYTARFMAVLPVTPIPPVYSSGSGYPVPVNPFGGGSLCPTPGGPFGYSQVPGYPAGYPIPSISSITTPQGLLDCAVSDPVRAATVWTGIIDARVTAAMAILRAQSPAQLTTLPDVTI